MKILIIEDELRLQESIKDSLEKEKYTVETASDFISAQDKIHLYQYDCILLDIMLPDGSGLDLLDFINTEGIAVNVIIISAKDALDDKLKGLDLGADDYLTKPFHLSELNARIKAIYRRKNLKGKNQIELNNMVFNFQDRELYIDNTPITLNRKEFDILHYFLLNKNRLVTKMALAEHVWGDHIDQADNFDFIYYQIKNLRKKIHHAHCEIESVYGIGYKLIET